MSVYHRAGQKLAALSFGCSPEDFATADGAVSAVNDHTNPKYGNLQRVLCKYAAEAFKEAGEMSSFEYELYKTASQAEQWYPEMDKFSDAVMISLGAMYNDVKEAEAHSGREYVKDATISLALPTLATAAARKTPDVLKSIAGLGVGAGAGIGSLIWLMNRHANQDDDNIEAMKAKVNYYNKLTGQIKQELGSEPATEDDVEEAVHDVF